MFLLHEILPEVLKLMATLPEKFNEYFWQWLKESGFSGSLPCGRGGGWKAPRHVRHHFTRLREAVGTVHRAGGQVGARPSKPGNIFKSLPGKSGRVRDFSRKH